MDIEARNRGMTPLLLACHKGLEESTKASLNLCADVNAVDSNGYYWERLRDNAVIQKQEANKKRRQMDSVDEIEESPTAKSKV